ncbi:Exopolysaccharide synthesis, ExoD [Anaplasma phagocytophilum]|uniref:Exopolysaccharide synthesis, ExoD n=2 Tax=Anaplasma phagocytophilum TaxID=948 RepID=A0AA45ZHA8_ANAPH|nr:Exopolysaccharide synthesis, ExoD [Anaplasma phagocytophilum]SBO30124.1 Exopolysaccharide synthesis, ExoD [Anaplasma phagocytophilum]SBO31145.1 Exopolysaccharide synthesis, ExoD [Anaplasma phagocytophilum]SBO31982.1 Exopolysaccharide synthesis, ExoD [Anaplasma phagocytophilum]SCV62828.1 Exopolysaccharide synthesis, ExoD [Anaplasma phagocytophilum]
MSCKIGYQYGMSSGVRRIFRYTLFLYYGISLTDLRSRGFCMDTGKDRRAVSDILEEVSVQGSADTVTLYELKMILRDRGFGVLMLLFSLPLSIPIPAVPGYTTILSLPLLLFSMQMLMGMSIPWLPAFLERKSFKRSFLAAIIEKTSPFLRKTEKWTKPRMLFIFCNVGERTIAMLCLLCAISIAIPLPLTNFIPAGGISAMALGVLNKDGVLVIVGVLLAFLGISVTAVVLIAGPKLVMGMFSFIYKFFVI